MEINNNFSLKNYNTFGIEAKAKQFVEISSEEELKTILQQYEGEKKLILGGGSNMLLTKDVDALVIHVGLHGKKIIKEDDDFVWVEGKAGENWHEFVMYCVERNWGGVENLSLIPGTVGAAPIQNIGAYGVEIKNIINLVDAIEIANGTTRAFTNAECRFGYRDSIFKQEAKDKYLISSITLTLTRKDHRFNTSYGAIEETMNQHGNRLLSVKNISDAVIHIRRTKLPDPARIGNAGSFFKNPSIGIELYDFIKKSYPSFPSYPSANGLVKVPAGWLIEQCGWKGKTFNNIGVHQHQALVIVNYGDGNGEKIWQLAMDICASVKGKFNITLQPEVNVVG